MGSKGNPDKTFQIIEQPEFPKIVELLKSRLPISGNVYNMALVLHKFPNEMKCFTLGESSNALVMIIFDREDYGQDINISLPNEFQVTDEIKQAFISTHVIDWTGPHIFVATDRRISLMILEISTLVFRNSVIFNPNYAYWKNPDQYILEDEDDVVVKKLEEEEGLKFLIENWRYARSGSATYLKKILNNHITSGVYYKGHLVSASVVNAHGLIGLLSTSSAYRNKGYAIKCMKYLMQEMAKQGLVLVSTAQQENSHSLALHKKVGMSVSHECDYVFHIPYLSQK